MWLPEYGFSPSLWLFIIELPLGLWNTHTGHAVPRQVLIFPENRLLPWYLWTIGGVCNASHPKQRAIRQMCHQNDIIYHSTLPETQESDVGVAPSHNTVAFPSSHAGRYLNNHKSASCHPGSILATEHET
uniref:Uncharacterized protein n=1 Tax=Mus musculus TaxID=10090 RepID=Q6R5D2_MOUSE|nr:unknown [Mus musculus]